MTCCASYTHQLKCIPEKSELELFKDHFKGFLKQCNIYDCYMFEEVDSNCPYSNFYTINIIADEWIHNYVKQMTKISKMKIICEYGYEESNKLYMSQYKAGSSKTFETDVVTSILKKVSKII